MLLSNLTSTALQWILQASRGLERQNDTHLLVIGGEAKRVDGQCVLEEDESLLLLLCGEAGATRPAWVHQALVHAIYLRARQGNIRTGRVSVKAQRLASVWDK